ncbi:MAG TPA: hypothetical protein DF712_12245 [Balneola sp.]|jgi:hypothetical protein|nr:hypothetical protein [Balneola sp.]
MKKFSIITRPGSLDRQSRQESLLRQIHTADHLIMMNKLKTLKQQIEEIEDEISKTFKFKR